MLIAPPIGMIAIPSPSRSRPTRAREGLERRPIAHPFDEDDAAHPQLGGAAPHIGQRRPSGRAGRNNAREPAVVTHRSSIGRSG